MSKMYRMERKIILKHLIKKNHRSIGWNLTLSISARQKAWREKYTGNS